MRFLAVASASTEMIKRLQEGRLSRLDIISAQVLAHPVLTICKHKVSTRISCSAAAKTTVPSSSSYHRLASCLVKRAMLVVITAGNRISLPMDLPWFLSKSVTMRMFLMRHLTTSGWLRPARMSTFNATLIDLCSSLSVMIIKTWNCYFHSNWVPRCK